MQEYTQKGGFRPFGTFLMFVGSTTRKGDDQHLEKSANKKNGEDEKDANSSRSIVDRLRGTPACFQVDPSGSFREVSVAAAGIGHEEAKKFMERRLELLDDNIVNALLCLKEYSGKEVHPEDVSMGVFRNNCFKVYSEEDVSEVFDSIKS